MFWNEGQIIHNGKYKIEKYLGGGGFALTYLATHTNLNRLVVIKTPNINVQNDPDYPKYVERFKKEGRMLAQVCDDSHPNIVQVMDLFEDDSRHCLVMLYIPGMSLWDLVRQQGKLSETTAVKYISQIGLALLEVHRRNLLHLDVTPPNIMINTESGTGKAVLIDFGIAADMSPPSTLSRDFGNKAFAPYELIRKGVRHPTVDVYCLAASLYYAVTGEIPTNSLARKWEEEELIPPQQYVSSLSQSCCDAILKGMALEVNERIQTMQEWLDLLVAQPKIAQSNNFNALKLLNSHLEAGQAQIIQGDYSKALELANIYINKDNLTSEVEIDYTSLSGLLKAQNWQEADKETTRLILKVANREKAGWLNVESINNFPCADLRTIDQLWVKYSNGRFGFSVQKRIYQSLGGTEKYDDKIWNTFGDRIGWRKGGSWVYYSNITFSLEAPEAHLPWGRVGEWGMVGWSWDRVVFSDRPSLRGYSSLASRLVKCSI
jgi:eukaryotic-like serine/threonine-protein kinase